MRLQLLLMQLLLCVLPGMEMGASCRLTAWVVEDSSGKVEITCIGDTMDKCNLPREKHFILKYSK